MLKRSLTISGHRTSIALEPQFWDVLDDIAQEQKLSISQLIARIDEERDEPNLSSAIRVFALDWALAQGVAE
ncbi:ribbon-helix-helix domain-containing protein [Pelagibacterium luteolum]|uniref:Ribbon-helix-helix domain-containing protein n=1 Tax=Pelagibacterium luteolum TaxID=440168 RepID=A0A1G7UI79_9HYPH|nr:ribbon-helix-helix domain-containing protein [Pelagibacterium luteolum]SDG47265.1 Ribbon-helix-helix domain-containing protein [Pelagibacterium luteolum]